MMDAFVWVEPDNREMLTMQNNAVIDPRLLVSRLRQSRAYLEELIALLDGLSLSAMIPGEDRKICASGFEAESVSGKDRDKISGPLARTQQNCIVAVSPQMLVAVGVAERMARSDEPVFICGPSGTGKQLFARTIHQGGSRAAAPFIWLQGETAMAANEALRQALVDAERGTLYLSDLDELNRQQLEVLQKVLVDSRQVGNCRIIAASRLGPGSLLENGHPVAELLGSLHGCYIELPPLSDRKADIEPLADHFIDRLCREMGKPEKHLSPEFLKALSYYSWPGNVRELINTLGQVVLTSADKKTLFAKDLPTHIRIQTVKRSAGQKKGL